MATPDFILKLREKIGNDMLWLPGVTALVMRENKEKGLETLLVKTFSGKWKPVTGIVDPGEQPNVAAEREVLEETCIHATTVRILGIESMPKVIYSNGDECLFMDVALLLHADEADEEPALGDEENAEVRWFPIEEVPQMEERYHRLLQIALNDESPFIGKK